MKVVVVARRRARRAGAWKKGVNIAGSKGWELVVVGSVGMVVLVVGKRRGEEQGRRK